MKIDKASLQLENNNIYIRPLLISDITEEYINGLNNPEVNKYLLNVRLERQTRELVEKYVILNLESEKDILFGIFIKNNPEPLVGTVRVSGIDIFHYSASIGVCLFAKRSWKKGYALQAIELVKNYLFNALRLHYLEAGVYEMNKNSINLFLKAGFNENYRVRSKFRHTDSFADVIFFSAISPLFNESILKKNLA